MNKLPYGYLFDSSTTLLESDLKKYPIEIIPLSISDEKDNVYEDDPKVINGEDLLKRIDNGARFKTSATPLGQLMEKIEKMLSKYEQVIFFPISQGLSSQFQQAQILLDEFNDRLVIVDTQSAAMGCHYVYKHFIESLESGESLLKTIKKVPEWIRHSVTYFSCEDLSGLVSGGRTTKAIVKAANVLKVKPIIVLDYKNRLAGIGINYKRVIKKIINKIKDDFNGLLTPDKIELINLYYGGYDEVKKQFLLNEIAKSFNYPIEKIIVTWVPTVVLCHIHRGAYGITLEASLQKNIDKKLDE